MNYHIPDRCAKDAASGDGKMQPGKYIPSLYPAFGGNIKEISESGPLICYFLKSTNR